MMRTTRMPMVGLSRVLMSVSLLLLIVAVAAPVVVAQDAEADFDPNPLRPADTKSPRDTLRGFNSSITKALQAWRAGEPWEVVQEHESRAMEAVDFSQLPKGGRFEEQVETVLYLKEILDRIEVPPYEEIPGSAEVMEKSLTRWTIPNTEITMAKAEDGPRGGKFLFTAETADRLKEFYERAKHLPYKPGALVGVHDELMYTLGEWLPRSWANALPAWSRTVVLGEVVWKWLAFAIVVVATILIIRWLLRWGHRWDERHRQAGALMRLGAPLSILAGILVLYAARRVFLDVVRLFGDLWDPLIVVLWVLIFSGSGWLLFVATSRVADAINEARRVKEGSIDGQLVRVLLRLVSLVGLVFLVFYAGDFFGVPLTPLVAGLGIGGLAIALAMRPTLENVIGGLTMFADKPVRVGDFCRYGEDPSAGWLRIGTVEQIGLRSTRIRGIDRTVTTIPNSELSRLQLINLTKRDRMVFRPTLGLRYETTEDQLRFVLAKLRELLLAHPRVTDDPARVRFAGFGEYSMNVEIFAYVNTSDWNEFLAIQEDINLRIIRIVKMPGPALPFHRGPYTTPVPASSTTNGSRLPRSRCGNGLPHTPCRSRNSPKTIGSRSWTPSTIHPMAHPKRTAASPAFSGGSGRKKEKSKRN